MKVQIEENLYIESDAYQFIIREYTARKDGNGPGKIIVHGYFSKLEHAVKHLITMKVKQSTAATLGELQKDVKRIEEYISSKITI
ncbi:hypothetical protein [Brevibacillus parabrevis]|uniref:hypothetical protein n=1 Tax=Brevibacillus parabrevis TaxID=54914 RepID=UPI0023807D34|nr:hypothetical protein [Brevibacillus parabrevis]WDV94203.1 hypothetical protein PSE45_21575 [Brevibacillus parabrevis]